VVFLSEVRIRRPRGTRDLLPDETVKRDYVERVIRRVFESYGFQRIETPIFETFDLFALRSGEEIRSKMFVFTIDEGEMVLRPELTAPVCRMIAMGEVDLSVKPLRFYYIGRCYRYEEPQAGRYREFWQAGLELMGSPYPEADAEVIAIAIDVLRELGLKDYELRIGNLEVLRAFLNENRIPEEVQNRMIGPLDVLSSSVDKLKMYKRKLLEGEGLSKDDLMDMRRRCDELRLWVEEEMRRAEAGRSPIPKELLERVEVDERLYRLDELYRSAKADELVDFIDKAVEKLIAAQKLRWVYQGIPYEDEEGEETFKMPPEVVDTLISMMELVGPREDIIPKARELFRASEKAMRALDAFEEVLDALSWYGIERYTVDLSIARGLEYYTGTVFEIDCPLLGAQKQICGGGRYDKLVEEFGGPSLPATGFAFGFDRLILALERSGVELPSPARADAYIIPLSPNVLPYAMRVAGELRSRGLRIEVGLMRRKLGRELANVDKLGIPFAIIIGPGEMERNIVALRNMETKEQLELPVEKAAELMLNTLGRGGGNG